MTRIVILFCIFSSYIPAFGQSLEWGFSIGSDSFDYLYDFVIDEEGNIYNIGSFTNTVDFDPSDDEYNITAFGGEDVYVQKVDSAGNLLWVRTFDGAGEENAYSAVIDIDGNIVIAGDLQSNMDLDPGIGEIYVESEGGNDVFIVKLDQDGFLIDAYTFGGEDSEQAFDIVTDSIGDVYVCGRFFGDFEIDGDVLETAGWYDGYIIKFSKDGDYLWSHNVGTSNPWDSGRRLVIYEGFVFFSGVFWGTADFDPGPDELNISSLGGRDGYMQKLDLDGNLIAARTIGNSDHNYMGHWTVDADGYLYCTGSFQGTLDFDLGPGVYEMTALDEYDIQLCKYTIDLELIWAKQIDGGSNVNAGQLSLDSENNMYLAGSYTTSGDFDPSADGFHGLPETDWPDVFVLKLDSNALFQWVRVLKGPGSDYVRKIQSVEGGKFYLGGMFNTSLDLNVGIGESIVYSEEFSSGYLAKYGICDFPVYGAITLEVCDSMISPSGRYVYYESGVYIDSTTTISGCDSIVTIALTVKYGFYSDTSIATCEGAYWRDNYYDETGYYDTVFAAVNGCDSTYALNLIIQRNILDSVVAICDSFTWNDSSYYESTIVVDSLTNIFGCDSIRTLDLTILNNQFDSTITSCINYYWNDSLYLESTVISDTMINIYGCDSIRTIHLDINSVNIGLTIDGVTMTSEQIGATYQWINCLDSTAIIDATEQSYTPDLNGEYAVIIAYDGCIDTSACITINSVNLETIIYSNNVFLYPNPAQDKLRIYWTTEMNLIDYAIVDAYGKMVLEGIDVENGTEIAINTLAQGIYFIVISDGDMINTIRFIRN